MQADAARFSTRKRIFAGVLAVVATAVAATLVEAGVVRQIVHGKLSATAEDSRAKGLFRLKATETDKGKTRERIEVTAKKLDAQKDDSGNLPDYHVVLTTTDGGATADFGSMTLTRNGRAGFIFDDKRDLLPDGVDTIVDFGGGTVEVRLGDDAVLSGKIPEFAKPTGDPGAGARGVRRDASRLKPTDDSSRAHGWLEARYAKTAKRENERIRAQFEGLSRNGSPYAVVVIAADATETELFTVKPRGRFGAAKAEINTATGGEIPGGSVTDLSGLDVEVRDADGNVVLTGAFPSIALD